MSNITNLEDLIKDLKENFDTVKDIILTYQNEIYRQSSDDYDDLKKFIVDVESNIRSIEDYSIMEQKKKTLDEKKVNSNNKQKDFNNNKKSYDENNTQKLNNYSYKKHYDNADNYKTFNRYGKPFKKKY